MAEKCICCGKKMGLLNGSHLNNQICDNCYFPIAGYLTALKENTSIQTIDDDYNQLIQKIKSSPYSENGKSYLINIANTLAKDKKDALRTEYETKLTRKNFKIATCYNFEGYKITEYFGVASGSTVLGTGFLSEGKATVSDVLGIESDSFSDKLEQARNSSVNKIINDAISKGGNALIGVSFDYINFTSNMIGVVANGTVVKIVEQESRA